MLSPAEAVNAIKSGETTEFVFMSVIGGTFDKPALILAPAEEIQRVLERQQDTWVVFSDTHSSDEEGDEDDGKTMLHLVPKALVPSWCPKEGLPMIGGVCRHHYEQGPSLLEDTSTGSTTTCPSPRRPRKANCPCVSTKTSSETNRPLGRYS